MQSGWRGGKETSDRDERERHFFCGFGKVLFRFRDMRKGKDVHRLRFSSRIGQPDSREETNRHIAEIAQLVEHNLAKVGVAGPSPVFRSQSRQSKTVAC